MGIRDLVKHVIQKTVLSLDYWAEEVTVQIPGQPPQPLTVQIAQQQVGDKWKGRQAGLEDRNSVDELDKILVFVATDPASDSGAFPFKPPIDTTLVRSSENDSDSRPFTFGGESLFRCGEFDVYTFQRTRRSNHSIRRR